MSDSSLTQHQKNLKSLQQSLIKICDDYKKAQECFIESQEQARSARYHINQSWIKVIELLL